MKTSATGPLVNAQGINCYEDISDGSCVECARHRLLWRHQRRVLWWMHKAYIALKPSAMGHAVNAQGIYCIEAISDGSCSECARHRLLWRHQRRVLWWMHKAYIALKPSAMGHAVNAQGIYCIEAISDGSCSECTRHILHWSHQRWVMQWMHKAYIALKPSAMGHAVNAQGIYCIEAISDGSCSECTRHILHWSHQRWVMQWMHKAYIALKPSAMGHAVNAQGIDCIEAISDGSCSECTRHRLLWRH